MSFLLIEGLSVHCPECDSTRIILKKGGPGMIQVSDQNALIQQDLQKRSGQRRDLFYVDAWCERCATPILASPAQAIANERNRLIESISEWDSTIRQKCQEKILEQLGLNLSQGSEARISWLKKTFHSLFRECFEDARCGLYPEFYSKMKKRFLMQVIRTIKRDGVTITDELIRWFKGEVAGNPFAKPIEDLQNRADSLTKETKGPWWLIWISDPWQGVNLNPYICHETTMFFAEGDHGIPLYTRYENDPGSFTSICERALRKPFEEKDN